MKWYLVIFTILLIVFAVWFVHAYDTGGMSSHYSRIGVLYIAGIVFGIFALLSIIIVVPHSILEIVDLLKITSFKDLFIAKNIPVILPSFIFIIFLGASIQHIINPKLFNSIIYNRLIRTDMSRIQEYKSLAKAKISTDLYESFYISPKIYSIGKDYDNCSIFQTGKSNTVGISTNKSIYRAEFKQRGLDLKILKKIIKAKSYNYMSVIDDRYLPFLDKSHINVLDLDNMQLQKYSFADGSNIKLQANLISSKNKLILLNMWKNNYKKNEPELNQELLQFDFKNNQFKTIGKLKGSEESHEIVYGGSNIYSYTEKNITAYDVCFNKVESELVKCINEIINKKSLSLENVYINETQNRAILYTSQNDSNESFFGMVDIENECQYFSYKTPLKIKDSMPILYSISPNFDWILAGTADLLYLQKIEKNTPYFSRNFHVLGSHIDMDQIIWSYSPLSLIIRHYNYLYHWTLNCCE